jgi:ribosomal protein L35
MPKTNKAVAKRLKLTKKGKLIGRKPGGNHFNAKERRVKQLGRKKGVEFTTYFGRSFYHD